MLKVLIVDDEENARLGLSKLLAQDGYQVSAVSNGFEALEHMQQDSADLIITDIKMPEMNGLVFLREVSQSFPQVKVIMLTAYGGVASYLEAMNLGAFEYLNKPVRLHDLKTVINRIFDQPNKHVNPLKGSTAAH
ncbi:MAG: response regulator [Deltaproteobacteria bacterium]|jgi:DNA-binding NtrC family response regulator|nr:response regulator [Deltaproteobacteria bacterium]MCW8893592.1 response regulator [Deltaproteobacteria bacterium]MCW9048825.1 response regulator [Deltaproteobacteria bacterium]